ncbi:MAG: transketolase [Gammaproteobacteria bacterium]|nr:transketolase [Gammaproteobacteria bacterium]MDD9799908.1 transketolase [Gammaproteobacteria bacterium]MDD9815271.1 transketolase [Gammaproteobacteria bacterium]MDD9870556.1 transketolase [Gammaproteobacteria bacterium]
MPRANNKKQHLRGAAQIREIARRVRARDLEMICDAGTGHIGGDLSCADILATLYFHVLHYTPEHPENPDRDRFVMSKGHCAGALYAVLAEAGFIDADELSTFMAPESRLNGHPSRIKMPGVETSTGPLGHGLPVAVGAAMAAKMENAAWRTFALLGDGELQEGSNWEAAMAAAHFKLDRLTVIVDRNGLQQGAPTETTNTLEPLANKWRAFGWETTETDGHDIDQMMGVFDGLPLKAGHPSCIIARTVKGRGVSFMQNKVEWHHKVPNQDERARAALELERAKTS